MNEETKVVSAVRAVRVKHDNDWRTASKAQVPPLSPINFN